MRKNKLGLISTTVAATVTAGLAHGQVPEEGDAVRRSLEEVIVTAQRQDESASRTPISINVIQGDDMAKANITTEDDLRSVAPGLSIRSSISSNQINYALRGQSKDAYTSARPGVLPYVNEVQIGGDGATVFYDLQSTQVLRGPQGTLFGRSATGGAVLLTTARPEQDLGGFISVLGGDYSAQKVEGAINLPIIEDTLLSRFAGFTQKRDGFQKNLYDGSDVGDIDRYGVRGTLSLTLDTVQNDLTVDYFNTDSENTVPVLSGLLPTGFIPANLLYAGTSTPQDRATGIGTVQAFLPPAYAAFVPDFYDAFFANPAHPNIGLTRWAEVQKDLGPFKIYSADANYYRAENIIVTNGTTIDLTDSLSLRNVFGYTDLDSKQAFDAAGNPYQMNGHGVPSLGNGYGQKVEQLSEELQLQGVALDDRLNYTVGLYYSDESVKVLQTSQAFTILLGGVSNTQDYELTNLTYAAYGQGTYDLNDDGLSVTLGLRHTSEEAGIEYGAQDSSFPLTALPGYDAKQETTYDRVSYHLGIQNQFTPELMVYGVTRRAYKSGGFNGSVAPFVGTAAEGGNGFDAERVSDVELGTKYNGFIGDLPSRGSFALFYSWGRDAQRASYGFVNGGPAALTAGVPENEIYGAEAELVVEPLTDLNVGVSLNYVDGEYSGTSKGATPIAGCDGATVVAVGVTQCVDQLTDASEVSGSLFTDFTFPLYQALTMTLHGDVYAQTKSYTSPQSANYAGTTITGYGITNFRVSVEDEEKGWSVTANLKNAFDKTYYVGGVATGTLYQVNTLLPGEPRTFTLEGRLNF